MYFLLPEISSIILKKLHKFVQKFNCKLKLVNTLNVTVSYCDILCSVIIKKGITTRLNFCESKAVCCEFEIFICLWFIFLAARHKALYVYEIRRMLHFFDDASQLTFDHSISDISDVFNKPHYSQEYVAQHICKQTSLLKANLCDQG